MYVSKLLWLSSICMPKRLFIETWNWKMCLLTIKEILKLLILDSPSFNKVWLRLINYRRKNTFSFIIYLNLSKNKKYTSSRHLCLYGSRTLLRIIIWLKYRLVGFRNFNFFNANKRISFWNYIWISKFQCKINLTFLFN